ncbi:ankyrin repeat-containing protein At5g02620-like [Syzygium oleosum]|uniref:ankyrin repeat-containing protein At5g02620-like n=1 Tax=Syzygium oleosum TaxID=219896 RepID=UPI0024B9F67B|nr:ankyrin repeat-containing protein At5g02620-like [Syzygium oleosum]
MHPKVYEAAKSGDFDSLKTIILGNGEDLFHQTTPKENNILHIAAQYGQVNFIEGLLQCPSGWSLLWQGNNRGDTPLHLAAEVGSCRVVQVFTDFAKSLHWVVENGQVDACKELLRKKNLQKDTVLHHAVRGGHDLVVELLIEEDSQLCDIINAADESPLYLAADRGLSRTTELILGAFSWSSSHKGPKGLTTLHAGIFLSLTVWEKILEKRPEAIREGDDMGWTPLHYVAYFGKVEAVQLLLQHDTSVACDLDKSGESALHLAAFQGHANVINELLRSCPDACDIMNTKGQNVLHAAVIGGRMNVVKYILRMSNLDNLINEQDTDGNTALHLAALNRQYDIICTLARDKRVDRLAKNKDHLTACDMFSSHEEVGFMAENVQHLLKGSHGIPGFQGWFMEHGKKRSGKQFVQGQPSVTITTGSNVANRNNFDLSKRSIMDVQLLVAGLIATVSFSVVFAVPGGYNNDGPDRGVAIFAGRADFEAFQFFNCIAFVFSIMAIIFHCRSITFSSSRGPRYIPFVRRFIEVATFGMVVAYFLGTDIASKRPPKSTRERISYYVALGGLLTLCFFFDFPDPVEAHSWSLGSSPARSIRKFWHKCEILMFDFPARLLCWLLEKLTS